jgi:PKD repeat protein
VYETEGTYDVTLRVENMFGFTEEIKIDYIVVVDPLGVEELLKNSLRIYPNPNNGNFNIEHNFEGPVQVMIFDMLGSMVYSGESSGSITNIGFEDLDKGIYFVKVTPENGNKTATGKIIVF